MVEDDEEGEDEPDAKDAKDDKGEDDKPEVDAERLDAARKALMRDGWTKKQLDKLEPEDILSIGEKRSASQTEVDRRLRDRTEERETPKTEGDTAPDEGTDLAIPAELLDAIGDEGAKHLTAYASRLTQRAVDQVAKPLQQQLAIVTNALESIALERAFEALAGDFPELRTPEGQEKAREALSNVTGRQFRSVTEMVRFAVGGALGTDARQKQRTERSNEDAARLRGQSTPPTSRPRSKPKTPDEKADELLVALEKKHGIEGDD